MALIVEDRVKETSTTTGTGDFTLAGAITGSVAFSSVCTSPTSTVYYMIQGVDASGVPTSEWETGLGTYSAANTLTRTTPQRSSNAGAAVNFSAGTKQVSIDLTQAYIALLAKVTGQAFVTPALGTPTSGNLINCTSGSGVIRECLNAARTYYVRAAVGTVTMTIASPAVVSLTAHGLTTNDPVVFTTTGALPTGIAAGTVYYVIAAGLTANAFEVSTSLGGSAVNTSGSQSGTHSAQTGNDSNNGQAQTRAGAFLTPQQAINSAASLDLGASAVTIQLADSTYTSAMSLKSYMGAGPITIQGNSSTPSNVLFDCTATPAVANSVLGAYALKDFKLQTSAGGLISANGTTTVVNFSGLVFGAASTIHITATTGATVSATGNYSITGGGQAHIYAISGGVIVLSGKTITLTGTPAFSAAFAWTDRGLGMFDVFSITFSGSATGTRYIINNNSVCFTNGGGATYFPGNASGTTSNGIYA